jgi:flagellar protein FlaG
MNSNVNSAPSPSDNGFMLKSAADLDYAKEDKVSLSAGNKTEADKEAVVNLTEQINAENKIKSQQKKEVSEDDINKALEVVSSFMNNNNKQVAFSNDNTSGKTVITITDKKTQEVINQFPSEKIILMAERIQDLHRETESISGLLIDSRV